MKKLIPLLTFSLAGLCACAGNGDIQPQEKTKTIPGWVVVTPYLSEAFIRKNKGRMYHNFDEHVGGLIDQGMVLSNTTWIKPSYGNQNLLWLRGAAFGKQIQQSMAEMEKEVSNEYSRYVHGDVDVAGVKWKYYGYQMNPGKGDEVLFQDYVFACQSNHEKGVTVFYWGDEMLEDAHKLSDVETLLKELNQECR